MRITHRAVTQTALLGLNRNLSAVNGLQQQLTSGKSISKPSDDPTGTNTAMQTRQELAGALEQQRPVPGCVELDRAGAAGRCPRSSASGR